MRPGEAKRELDLNLWMNRFVMKAQQLFGLQSHHRVCAPVVITELNFVHSRHPAFHNGPDLAANQTVFREVLQEGDDRTCRDFVHRGSSL